MTGKVWSCLRTWMAVKWSPLCKGTSWRLRNRGSDTTKWSRCGERPSLYLAGAQSMKNSVLSESIFVCPLLLIPDVLRDTGARHLVSAIDTSFMPSTPAVIVPERHLKLEMHDVVEAKGSEVVPALEHVEALLRFAETWDGRE